VKALRFVIDAFVNTFGITRPTPENEARSGKVIALMLVGVVLVLVAAADSVQPLIWLNPSCY
jgi:hypothetical protein